MFAVSIFVKQSPAASRLVCECGQATQRVGLGRKIPRVGATGEE